MGVGQDAAALRQIGGNIVAHAPVGALYREIGVVHIAAPAQHLAAPVDIWQHRRARSEALQVGLGKPGLESIQSEGFVHRIGIARSVGHPGQSVGSLHAKGIVGRDCLAGAFATAGRNQNDSVGATQAVNSRRCGVPEHRNALYFV